MTLEFREITGSSIAKHIGNIARLRVEVFREWPYLYDGDPEYEARYLANYAAEGTVLVSAFADGRMVGAATGMAILDHDDHLSTAIVDKFEDLSHVFYCAESILLSEFRRQGAGHHFFDRREAFAKARGFREIVFSAVVREDDHPSRPSDYTPLDGFWRARGYKPLEGALAGLSWRDLGADQETMKDMQFWHRRL